MVKRKLSKGGLTVKTFRYHSYPGDNSVQVRVVDERLRGVLVFNLWPITRRGMRFWENDRFGVGPFQTITKWKQWALEKALDEASKGRRRGNK